MIRNQPDSCRLTPVHWPLLRWLFGRRGDLVWNTLVAITVLIPLAGLIGAAATAARYASGAASRDQAVAALNEALARIQVLAGPASPISRAPASEGALSRVFLALVLAGAHDRRGVRPDLGAAP